MKYCRGFCNLENFPAYMDFSECCMERNTHKWDGKNAASAVGRPRCWISRRSSVKSFGMAQGVRCHWRRNPIARELWVFWQAARYRGGGCEESQSLQHSSGRNAIIVKVTVMDVGECGLPLLDVTMKKGEKKGALLLAKLPPTGRSPLLMCQCVAEQCWVLLRCKCRHSAAAGGKLWLCALLNRN